MQISTMLLTASLSAALAGGRAHAAAATDALTISTELINRLVAEARTNNPSLKAADSRVRSAERTTGRYFLDFTPNRQVAARYGLTVGDVNDIVETAIGGKTIATTVEGRERYPINVRYARDFREDLDALKRVLVPLPMSSERMRE